MSAGRFLWALYRPRQSWLALAFVCLALTWIAGAALLALSGWFITACGMAGLGLLLGLDVFTPSSAIRGLALLRTAGRYAERVVGHEAILRLLADLRVRVFHRLAHQAPQAHGPHRDADVVTRLMADVDTLDGAPLRVFGPFLAACASLCVSVAIAVVAGPWSIALCIALSGLSTLAVAVAAARWGRVRSHALVQARAIQRTAVIDHLAGLAELRSYNKAQASLDYLATLDQAQLQRQRRQEAVASWGEHGVQALVALATLCVIALGWSVVTAPTLALLALMTLGLNEALGALPGALWRLGESEAAGERLMALESQPRAPAMPLLDGLAPGGDATDHPMPLVLRDLRCQRQPEGIPAFDAVLHPGRPLVVHGPSGSGKSSLMDTLAGELAPLAGGLWRGEQNLLALDHATRTGQVAYLAQSDLLLDLSVRAFLGLGLGPLPDARLWEVLRQVGLDAVLQQTGEGLDYRLGTRGSRVSGGQARRLQLAALLLRDPALVLLDEPFRGMEPALVQHLLTECGPWLARRCCVLITHDPQALPAVWPRQVWPLPFAAKLTD
ncbi:MAG: ATP-binding cassette domain-containing protein [Giesbergeria sp.]|uniref:amino acid ABC transporter ATP-binding/permease protein n=1 Tax=Giesbergeria sp. TaxID=2818473 RepID=UPI00260A4127|nr:ATP-binding cassette domain-containing protein [Giesbergeria sp.]MDD2609866.1 ATP-binding cassette domain-containing protein [Giesbergeria sp.]